MKFLFSFAVLVISPAYSQRLNDTISTGPQCACSGLAGFSSNATLLPSDARYATEQLHVWDKRSDQTPACIFLPQTAGQVSQALEIFNTCGAEFAVRGGGHMNFPGSNNIDNGVLLFLSHLNVLKLSDDKETIAVGPGNRWIDVYSALEPDGLYAIGGRLKTIGVPGLTLIGGVNYFINKYGFAMDNVVSYDVVLGNGTQVVVNATSNPDLFWALKGGANNYGIVTKFVLKTFKIPQVSTTIQIFDEEGIPAYIQAVCDFVEHTGNDASVAAGAVFNINFNVTEGKSHAQVLGSQEGTETPPSRFLNFSDVPGNKMKRDMVTSPAQFSSHFDTPNQLYRVQFGHHTIKLNATRLTEMYEAWREALDDIVDVQGLFPTFVLNAAPKSAASIAKNNGVGNVWGLDDDEHHIWWQLVNNWDLEQDDLRINAWTQRLVARFHGENQALGLSSEFLYIGDAGEFQDPYATIPDENRYRMLDIRDRYDEHGVFRKLNWGGFKLGF